MRVRGLYVVDLAEIIREVNMGVLHFRDEYGITSISDLTNLFSSRMILRMSEVYGSVHEGLIVFYLNRKDREALKAARDFINYGKFLTLVEKKIAIPLFCGNLPYKSFLGMLEKRNCPEYEEMVAIHKSFAEFFPRLAEQARKLRYHQINREMVNDTKNLLKKLTSL